MSIAETDATSAHLRPGEDLLEIYRRTGAAEDFERVVNRYAALVYGECRRVTRDAHDTEDAAQLAFLALAIELRSGGIIKRPAGWLQRVAKRQALKIVRSRGRRKRREDAARRDEMLPIDPAPMDPATRDATAELIREAIDALPEKHRLPLVLHYFGGMTLEAIGRELNLTRTAVGTRLHRARKQLGDRLGERGLRFESGELSTIVALLVPAAVIRTLAHKASAGVVMGTVGAGSAATLAAGVSQLMIVAGGGLRPIAAAAAAVLFLAGSGVAWVGPSNVVDAIRDPGAEFRRWMDQLFDLRPKFNFSLSPQLSAFESHAQDASLEPLAENSVGGDLLALSMAPSPIAGRAVFVDRPSASKVTADRFASQSSPQSLARWAAASFIAATIDDRAENPGDEPVAASYSPARQPVLSTLTAPHPQAFSSAFPSPDLTIGTAARRAAQVGDGESLRARSLTLDSRLADGGSLLQTGGLVSADRVVIGDAGRGDYDLRAGRLTTGSLTIGNRLGSDGTLRVGGGSVAVTDASRPIVIGGSGAGRLYLGTKDAPGRLAGPTGAPIIVGATTTAQGLIQGWGTVDSHGPLINNGRIVADGYGKHRTLDLSKVESVINTIDNPKNGTKGWHAQNGGEIALPAIPVKSGTGTYTWGENSKDHTIDLVNSLRFRIIDQPTPTNLSIRLITPSAQFVPVSLPGKASFFSVWSFSDTLDPKGMDFVVRYDHEALSDLVQVGVNDQTATRAYSTILFGYEQSAWRVALGGSLDPNQHLLTGSFDGSIQYLAVGLVFNAFDASTTHRAASVVAFTPAPSVAPAVTPEPTTLLAVGVAATLFGTRRRRRIVLA